MNNSLEEDLDYILGHTSAIWKELKGKRIFITGGTGFFGCWLLESFAWANAKLELNAKVTVLSRNPDRFALKCPHLIANTSIQWHKGDIINFDFPDGDFSHIIHAATELSPDSIKKQPIKVLDTIIVGTRRVLEFARQANTKKILLTSSGAVYGKQPVTLEHISETYCGAPDTMNPIQVYGEGKRVAEQLSSIYSELYGIEAKIARCFAFVGPYLPLDAHFAIGNFIKDGLQGMTILVNGDGTPYRSYLYASDLMICLWNILSMGKNCSPYNVGSAESFSIKQVARCVADCFNKPINISIRDTKKTTSLPERYVPAVNKLREDNILLHEVSLQTAIQKTIAWYNLSNYGRPK